MTYKYNRTKDAKQIQEELDTIGSSIEVIGPVDLVADFKSEPNLTEEKIIEAVLKNPHGINTRTIYKNGKKRKQIIGGTRSAEDLYLICKHYLPNTSFNNVLQVLNNKYEVGTLYTTFCCTHRKYMFRHIDRSSWLSPEYREKNPYIFNIFKKR